MSNMVLRDACASKKYEKGTTKYGKSKQKVNDKCNKVGENNEVKKKYKESTKKYVKIQKSKENEQILMQRNLETGNFKSVGAPPSVTKNQHFQSI